MTQLSDTHSAHMTGESGNAQPRSAASGTAETSGTPEGTPETTQHVPSILDFVRIVLVSPSHPGNVGSTARAMKTMGLTDLMLVSPRDPKVASDKDALALATGAADLLERCRIVPTLDDALADCTWSVALTARSRDLSPSVLNPRAAVQIGLDQILAQPAGARIAFVFGSERYGLDNEDVLRCQARCRIPTSATYSSLNLSQAVQLVAYECQLGAMDRELQAPGADAEPMATHAEREQMLVHMYEALESIGFLKPTNPKRLADRLRRMFYRMGLERDEVKILRGICTAILSPRK